MGGTGSTRWQDKQIKALVEKTPRASVHDCGPRPEAKMFVVLSVQNRSTGEEIKRCRVQVDLSPRPRNGYAVRFVCGECGQRRKVLYYVDGRICCRVCGRLVHQSTRQSHDFEAERLFRTICREQNITGLTYGTFMNHFRRK